MWWASRVIAWVTVLGAVFAIAFVYDSLPAQIPLNRWSEIQKTPFLALRVPLINGVSLALIEVLIRSLIRLDGFSKANALAAILYLTVAAKACLEGAELLLLPDRSYWIFVLLIGVLAMGIGFAVFQSRELWRRAAWRKLRSTSTENVMLGVLLAGLVALNWPLMSR